MHSKLRNVEEQLPYAGCRRIALLHRSLSNLELPKDRRYCSAWLQYELHRSGTIFRLLRGQNTIGLISARNALPELLEKLTGVAVRYFEIPDMYRDLKTQVEGSGSTSISSKVSCPSNSQNFPECCF